MRTKEPRLCLNQNLPKSLAWGLYANVREVCGLQSSLELSDEAGVTQTLYCSHLTSDKVFRLGSSSPNKGLSFTSSHLPLVLIGINRKRLIVHHGLHLVLRSLLILLVHLVEAYQSSRLLEL